MAGPQKFVEVISSDSDSEAEIEIIPFTKPPPPLIELIESSDEEEPSKNGKKKPDSPKTKKSGSKSPEKLKNSLKNSSFLQSVSNGANVPQSDQNAASPSKRGNRPETDTATSAINVGGDAERLLIHAVQAQGCENNASNAGFSLENSRNAGITSNTASDASSTGLNPIVNPINPEISASNEPNCLAEEQPTLNSGLSVQPNNAVLGDPLPLPINFLVPTSTGAIRSSSGNGGNDPNTGPIQSPVGSFLGQEWITMGNNTPKSARGLGKSNGLQGNNKRPRDSSSDNNFSTPSPTTTPTATATTTATPTPRKRISKKARTARQRTDEEIHNFLTTLGIASASPSQPAKRSRKRKGDPVMEEQGEPMNFDPSLLVVPLPPSFDDLGKERIY